VHIVKNFVRIYATLIPRNISLLLVNANAWLVLVDSRTEESDERITLAGSKGDVLLASIVLSGALNIPLPIIPNITSVCVL